MAMTARGFDHYVKKSPNGCWHWTGGVSPIGYGVASVQRRPKLAHRVAYERHHGVQLAPRGHPDHRQVDHTCHNRSKSCRGGPNCLHRRCVNPAHLELVTAAENTERSPHTPAHQKRRQTHCGAGHELTPGNVYTPPREPNKRQCRTCRAKRDVERKARLRTP